MKTDWATIIGGALAVIGLSCVVVPVSFFLGLTAGNVYGFWLIATGAPVIFCGVLALLLRRVSPNLAKGMLLGACLVFLVAGTCNWNATENGRAMPMIAG